MTAHWPLLILLGSVLTITLSIPGCAELSPTTSDLARALVDRHCARSPLARAETGRLINQALEPRSVTVTCAQ